VGVRGVQKTKVELEEQYVALQKEYVRWMLCLLRWIVQVVDVCSYRGCMYVCRH
jgi:hypothetical protein